jgi:hypothetical protein
MKPILTLSSLFACALCFGQVSFSDSSSLLVDQTVNSGCAMGIADMNGDGLDDIVRLDNAGDLQIEYQNAAGTTMGTYIFGNLGSSNEWALAIADVDGNGYNDVVAGGAYNGVKLLTANATGTAYTSSLMPGPGIFVQATNFVDIDNNGTVDIFACHDDGISAPYNNDGAGNFTHDLGLIFAESTVPSDDSGNYGTVWIDYDNDGDLDMYHSKCRLGVGNTLDGRRLNMLWENDGAGNYTDVAQARGLRPEAQSWAADWADWDLDGDLDCFIINHDILSGFYENDGTHNFTNETASTGTTTDLGSLGLGIQCIFEDFDNDTYEDLLFTGRSGSHMLFWNNGDGTFTGGDPFSAGGNGIQSAVVGDLNNDGFMDVYAGFATGFNSPSSNPDMIFTNDGNTNGWIKVRLQGVTSNPNGIGARVELHGAWGVQMRDVKAGESYGISHTHTQHFGLGTETTIDELVINWPDGTQDVITNPTPGQEIVVVEGSSPPVNCPGDLDGNLVVNSADILLFLPEFGCFSNCTKDFSGDGIVNTADILILLSFFGTDCL